jgi:tetratricopeptide (TPR) repeat protein/predicted aspartyl protease
MSGLQPLVHAKVNGTDAVFLADSGAFFSLLTPAAAQKFKLHLESVNPNLYMIGVGGDNRLWLTHVKALTIFNHEIADVPFMVGGNDMDSAVGVLGQNVFRIADVEYDLANGVIRIMSPKDCKSAALAYWAKPGSYSVIDISIATTAEPHTTGTAYLNGTKIKVLFDTGAAGSLLSLEAAKRAGITPTSEGVVGGGLALGAGGHTVATWIAPFHSFKIGEEEIRDTKLSIGEVRLGGVDMLLGADFFLSHRIYVANSQSKAYFTYNGGPVFNLHPSAKATAAAGESIVVASGQALQAGPAPPDAAGFSRRGTAAAVRQDYPNAIADLTRAVELAPSEPSYRYQRGMAFWGDKQQEKALGDFDAAIKLKPDDVPTLLARARLRVHRSDLPGAVADLDAADRSLPKEAPEHVEIGELYMEADHLPAAIAQLSKWIDSRDNEDVRMPWALKERCWARAITGQELDKALSDCNKALRLGSKTPDFLDSRALVYLRLGNYDRAIEDYDAALAGQPKIAWSHYGRGIAKLRKGDTAAGQADIAAAVALSPKIKDEGARRGIIP